MQQKLTLDPTLARAIHLHQTGDLAGAQALYRQILAANPDQFDALHLLGVSENQLGRNAAAIELIRRALMIRLDSAEAHANLGTALADHGRSDEAIDSYRRAVALKPDLAGLHYNLAGVLRVGERLDEAVASYRRAIALRPNFVQAHNNLGSILQDQLRLDEAIACFRGALALQPAHASAADNLILALDLQPATDAETALEARRRWCAQHAAPHSRSIAGHGNDPDPERRLRVGYVSADFRRHSCAYFLEPLLTAHDRGQVEIFAYSQVPRSDEMTDRFRALAGQWRGVVGIDDEAVATMIRSDRIDILVDLSGFTGGNRLRVFARKPAPVQLSWLGYPGTTGLPTIDYRLTDDIADPPGAADRLHTERLVRLPQGFVSYRPYENAPPVSTPPSDRGAGVTFGSFNALAKLNDGVVRLWALVLKAVPAARLMLKAVGLIDATTQKRVADAFARYGIPVDRLEFHGLTVRMADHLQYYHRVDIGLDPFPYNGTTTTCEALWMGVPVVTLAGDCHAGRVGASLLTRVGVPELIAVSEEDYVAKAAALAADTDRLARLRRSLRDRMAASPLCDAASFASAVEAAYRTMWRNWCERQKLAVK